MEFPEFDITANGPVSQECLNRNLGTFMQAADFIQQLPYARNANKKDLLSVFLDVCGTCSTKHALLKQLAEENGFKGLHLMLGIYLMTEKNTPKVAEILRRQNLKGIPEAHNYLKFNKQIFDFTRRGSGPADFVNELISEVEISPMQIGDFKVNFHKKYLKNWLAENPYIKLSLDELWAVREECINELGR